MSLQHRRDFLRRLGLSAAALPLLGGLTSLGAAEPVSKRQRVIFVFSPNGTVPSAFWPEEEGSNFKLKPIMKSFEPFKNRLLTLKGVNNRVRGDGDSHMRGMSCLLTGIELFPGNIMGGGGAPAGWASGPSIDQVMRNFLQSTPENKTRMGSLEIGVGVGNRADPWTRWSYAGPNQPVAPVSSPYELFDKLYGSMKEGENLVSVLDSLKADIAKVAQNVDAHDRALLDQHAVALRELERGIKESQTSTALDAPAPPAAGVAMDNDSIPQITRLQTELLISAFRNDMARISTFQFTNSVGGVRMKWLGIEEGHHSLSHDPDLNTGSVEKLVKINTWFAEQIAYLAKRLQETPEPNGKGNMLDNTTIVWTNELGKGNSHSHEDIPWVLIGGGLGFKTGRALKFNKTPHNRLLLAIAHGMGNRLKTFGNPSLCEEGPLKLS